MAAGPGMPGCLHRRQGSSQGVGPALGATSVKTVTPAPSSRRLTDVVTEPCMLQARLPHLTLGSSDSPGKGATCPRNGTPRKLLYLFLLLPPPLPQHLAPWMCDWGLGFAEGFPCPVGLSSAPLLLSLPSGWILSLLLPCRGEGGSADREAWGQRDLAVL